MVAGLAENAKEHLEHRLALPRTPGYIHDVTKEQRTTRSLHGSELPWVPFCDRSGTYDKGVVRGSPFS